MNKDIEQAISVLMEGGIILYPTDTVWGIGCDATNKEAVEKIYKLKQREDSKSMLVLLNNENRLTQYIEDVPEIAWELIDVSDNPMTLIYPGAKNLAENLIAEDNSIGIRIVKDAFCDKLLTRFKKPLVSTSANISGEKTPSIFDEISEEIKTGVDYIVNYGQNEIEPKQASSIIKLGSDGTFRILRK
jgi:L-threonylcarbamoyladenylate synthase